MKALVCEMCNSNDLVKQDGMYICQSCGTKYTVEEAKKLMGTVKIDESGKVSNYLSMAEKAYDAGNKEEAENYCNKIIEIESDNYKAWFLKGKAAGWQSTLANLRIEESIKCFSEAVDVAPEEEKEGLKNEAAEEIESLSTALLTLCCDNFADFASKNNRDSINNNVILTKLYSLRLFAKWGIRADGFSKEIATKINNSAMTAWNNNIKNDYWGSDNHPSKYALEKLIEQGDYVIDLLQTAIDLCDDDDARDITRYKNLIGVQTFIINAWSYKYSNGGWEKDISLTDEAKTNRIDKIMEWHNKIKEIDPNYEIPPRPVPLKKSGCYVATAVYGSYDCPQVWTLRRYRDDTLSKTWYGRAFIHTYYKVSPTLVKWFGKTNWFKNMWKPKLDKMVKNLNSEGVENTPYEDKQW